MTDPKYRYWGRVRSIRGLVSASVSHILSLSDGKKLENMAIGIAKVDPAAATAVVYTHVFQRPWSAPVRDPRLLDTPKNMIEIFFAHLKSIVMPLELRTVFKIQR